jgi:transposase-like protein
MSQAEVRREWEVRIAAYRSSGQSATDWCSAHQLQPHQLWYWIRKFKTTKDTVNVKRPGLELSTRPGFWYAKP